jgi:hypothetical protein
MIATKEDSVLETTGRIMSSELSTDVSESASGRFETKAVQFHIIAG